MTELYAIVVKSDDTEQVVAPGPMPWDAMDFSRRIGELGLSVALPAAAMTWNLDDGRVRIVAASVVDQTPPRTHYVTGYSDVIGDAQMTRYFRLAERDLDEVRAELIKADKLLARSKINDLDLGWMIEREALEGIPVPQEVKDARQAIVDAQRSREEWLLTATADELGDPALTGIPGWESIPATETPVEDPVESPTPEVEPAPSEPSDPTDAPAETTPPTDDPVEDDTQPA